jgi:hypothetical protein
MRIWLESLFIRYKNQYTKDLCYLQRFSIAFDPRGWGKLGPIGLATIVGLHFHVGAAVSFGAMNPARVFGPAVVYSSWANHWVYWVGSIPGAAMGGCIYEYLFMKREHARSTVPSTAGETHKRKVE